MQEACKVPWFCSQHYIFAPSSLEVAAGFLVLLFIYFLWGEGQGWYFCVLLSIIGPTVHVHSYL